MFDEDESWFSRFAQPTAHAWAAHQQPLRLVERDPQRDAGQKAVACFGALRPGTDEVYLDFCEGQPNSEQTWAFVQRLLDTARQEAMRVVVIIWDQASWHKSKRLKGWIRAHNRQAKQEGDVRLLTFLLPKKSPWLNPIEPHWVHSKRSIAETDRPLTCQEIPERVYAHFGCPPEEFLPISKKST